MYLIQKAVAVKPYDLLRETREILCTYIYESNAWVGLLISLCTLLTKFCYPSSENAVSTATFVVEKILRVRCYLQNREYGRGDPLRWPRDTLYPQKLALRLQAAVARSV
jgi:hypothetical protein